MKRLPYFLLAAMLGIKLCSLFQARPEKPVVGAVQGLGFQTFQEVAAPSVRLVLPADLSSTKTILIKDHAQPSDPTLPKLKIRPEYLIETAAQ